MVTEHELRAELGKLRRLVRALSHSLRPCSTGCGTCLWCRVREAMEVDK